MIKCPYCGAELKGSALFCKMCGHVLREEGAMINEIDSIPYECATPAKLAQQALDNLLHACAAALVSKDEVLKALREENIVLKKHQKEFGRRPSKQQTPLQTGFAGHRRTLCVCQKRISIHRAVS